MKRFLMILLAGLLILSLAACNSGTEDPGNSDLDIDFGSIMAGNGDTDTVFGQMNAADRQAFIDAAKENGMEASFGADGSLTLKDPNGSEIVQKADGTWIVKGEDGGEGQFGGNWPDNNFTRLVPKPDFSLIAAYGDDESFNVSFENVTLEQIRSYAEKVKAKGFTIDPETLDQTLQGVSVFSYTAENSDGYRVQVVLSSGVSAITITAP